MTRRADPVTGSGWAGRRADGEPPARGSACSRVRRGRDGPGTQDRRSQAIDHHQGQHTQIGYIATAVVFSFCTLTTETFFMTSLLGLVKLSIERRLQSFADSATARGPARGRIDAERLEFPKEDPVVP